MIILTGIFLPYSFTMIPPPAFISFCASSYAFLKNPPSRDWPPVSGSAAPSTISLGAVLVGVGAVVGAMVGAMVDAVVAGGFVGVGGAVVAVGPHATKMIAPISNAARNNRLVRILLLLEKIVVVQDYRIKRSEEHTSEL